MSIEPENEVDQPTPFAAAQGVQLDLTKVEILTNRLVLRSLTLEYLDPIFQNFTESLTRYMVPSAPKEKAETEGFVSDSMEKQKRGDDLVVAILLQGTGEFLGCCGLHGRGDPQHPELGIWIKEAAHGNGYGKEAVTAVGRWAETNLKYEYLIYPVDKNNIASRKIPEALGGTIFKEEVVTTPSGKQLDEVVYKISHPTNQEDRS